MYDGCDDFRESPETPRRRAPVLPILLGLGGLGVVILLAAGFFAAFLATGGPRQLAVRPVRPPQVAAATAGACEELGRRFEEAASKGADALAALIDWDTITERSVAGLPLAPASLAELKRGVRNGAARGAFVNDVIGAVERGGQVDFLRVVRRNAERRALCRMIDGGGAVSFFELLPSGGPEPRAADVFAYGIGEDISAGMRRIFLPIVAHENRSLLAKLAGTEADLVKHLPEISEMTEASRRGDNADTLRIYDGLPASLKREKSFLLVTIDAASMTDDDRYLKLLGELKSEHPDDPSLDLHLIDYHYLRNEYDEAASAARRLDHRVGGDAYMQTLIAGMSRAKGQTAEAGRLAEAAAKREPDLAYPHVLAIGCAIEAGDLALAVRRLEVAARAIDIDPDGLREALADYKGHEAFFDSEEFRAWEASEAGKADAESVPAE